MRSHEEIEKEFNIKFYKNLIVKNHIIPVFLDNKRVRKYVYIQYYPEFILLKVDKNSRRFDINNILEENQDVILKNFIKAISKKVLNYDLITQSKIDKFAIKIKNLIEYYSKLIGVNPTKIKIKKLKTAWGKCNIKGEITINVMLCLLEDKFIEYVIIHELCHMKYMDHSQNFWNMVGKYCSNYILINKELKKYQC